MMTSRWYSGVKVPEVGIEVVQSTVSYARLEVAVVDLGNSIGQDLGKLSVLEMKTLQA
ncbi:hypothetical protein ACVOMV_06910 [Mesorhizobium atlanticum]